MRSSRSSASRGVALRRSGALLGAVVLTVVVAAIPGPKTPPTNFQAQQSQPVYPPVSEASYLTTNNVRPGTFFDATIHAPPGALGLLLVSSNQGPSTILGQPVELAADWRVLAGPMVMGPDWRSSLSLPVPNDPLLEGFELRLQAAVIDPASLDFTFTAGAVHRVSAGGPVGLSVLILRQTMITPDAPFAPQAPLSLSQGLAMLGCGVDMVDDVLPDDVTLSRYDCVLDCRFNVPPAPQEAARWERYLRTQGGAFFLCGPGGSVWGEQRRSWIEQFLVQDLGIGVAVLPGGNVSGVTAEMVSNQAPSDYLNFPYSVGGTAYSVEDEGGSFGVLGTQSAGSPWIVAGPATTPNVFGMFFEPSDVTAIPVRGRIAVLFNGSADAFADLPENPAPAMIFFNACFYLDA